MKIDHHIHTTRYSLDSELPPKRLIAEARAAGLDGVVITEHDHQWRPEEIAELAKEAGDLLVLTGAEISARDGHMLVYGLPDLSRVRIRMSTRDLVDLVNEHDGLIVAAHPYRWGQDFDRILEENGPCFHALECVSKNVDRPQRRMIEGALSRHPGIHRTGSSDSHEEETVGCYYTEFDEPIRSMREFIDAVKAGKGRPGHTVGRPLASGPVG